MGRCSLGILLLLACQAVLATEPDTQVPVGPALTPEHEGPNPSANGALTPQGQGTPAPADASFALQGQDKPPSAAPALPAQAKDQPAADEKAPAPNEFPEPNQVVPDLAKAESVIPPAQEHVIDLDTAFRLAEVQNPNIALGRQAIQEALAERLQAQALLLPSLRAGLNYHLHRGVLQTSFGLMRKVNSSGFYFGGGASTLAAESLAIPAVQIFSPLGDALFAPLVARQLVSIRNAEATAIANRVLLEVSERYLDLLGAEASLQALKQSEIELNRVVQITAGFAKTGQGREGDARRAQAEAYLLHIEREQAEQELAVAAAELARVLHLDPSIRLRSPEGKLGLIEVIDPQTPFTELVGRALNGRPELAARQMAVARRDTQIRQERARPLLPTISIGFSSGAFGGGTNRVDLVPVHPGFGRFGGRTDLDIVAYWTLQNFGVGNRAWQNQRRAQRNEAIAEESRMSALVQLEVARALANLTAKRQQVVVNERRLKSAAAAFDENYRRIRGGVGLPIEILNSMNLLVEARLGLIRAAIDYNQAQFQLFVALGQTPS